MLVNNDEIATFIMKHLVQLKKSILDHIKFIEAIKGEFK